MKYAKGTKVPVSRSRDEIERLLTKYGADQFIYGWREERAQVGFRMDGVMVQMVLPLEDCTDQEVRQAWRVLLLLIKAKLETIDAGLSTVRQEFLSDILLPDGKRVGEFMVPQIEDSYKYGGMPMLLPGAKQ